MSVRFLIGRSGFGKTHRCLEEIRELLNKKPQGSPLLFLAPDQMTFQIERTLVASGEIAGMIRAQVFSFSRLAWRVLQETGGLARMHVTKVGTHMLLRKIIEQQKSDLRTFQRAADQSGFIEKMAELIGELKRYCIAPQALPELTDKSMQDKLHDLQLIYTRYEEEMANRYVDSEDDLKLLAEQIEHSTYLQDCEVWVDGFHRFTPVEYLVLEALIKKAKRITFALTLDEPVVNDPDDLDLFHQSAGTYQKIASIAKQSHVDIEEPLVLDKPHRFRHPSLAHLEAEYDHRPAAIYRGDTAVRMAAAVHRRAEVEAVARNIIAFVRDEGLRFRDISVMVRNQEHYSHFIETVFTDYQIPFFFDEKRSMLHHPLVELIRSSLEAVNGNWRYEAVFRAVKTDFFIPARAFERLNEFRERFDELENIALKFGVQGKRWKDYGFWTEKIGQRSKKRASHMLTVVKWVVEPLTRFEQALNKAENAREMATALFDFLVSLDVPEKLEYWMKQEEGDGHLERAREHEQAWKSVLSFLDELVEVVGPEDISLDLFVKLVESGLEGMTFSLVPPAMDQVLIGSLDRSRYTGVKCAFLIGANEGILPAKPNVDGMLSEEEREKLADAGVLLGPGERRRLLDEQFYIYQALTTASEQLWVSYPLADEEGKSLFPSPLIKRLKELFPDLEETLLVHEPDEDQDPLDYVTNRDKTLTYLNGQLRRWKLGYPIDPIWWDVYNWFVEHESGHAARIVANSLFYTNKAIRLSKETSEALYGETVQVSVSRMERFQACAFQQFVSHGLRLKERDLFRLDAPDIGLLFHDALNRMTEELRQRGVDWASLREEQCMELAERHVEWLAPKLQSEILLSSNRHRYLTRKLKQVVGRAAVVLSRQARKSGFSPVGLEVPFGNGGPIPAITYELKNGAKLEVVGRIDRIDQAVGENGLLIRVIDYKSGARDISLAEVYYGIALQMLTYLDVVITHAPTWLGREASPAGVLYFHVHNPMLQTKHALQEDEIEEEWLKKFKMKGLVLADQEAIVLMDKSVLEKDSAIIPVALKKDGSFKKYSKVASKQQFEAMRRHVRRLIQSIGLELTEGVIDIMPYQFKNKTACMFCSFRSICQFDPSLEENRYRRLKAEKDDVFLAKFLEQGGESDA